MYILKAIGPMLYCMENALKCWQTWRKSNLKELEMWHSWHTTKSLTLLSGRMERGIICTAKHVYKYIWLAF